jgi:glycosyltransferase involved in cell wall biosynthesis
VIGRVVFATLLETSAKRAGTPPGADSILSESVLVVIPAYEEEAALPGLLDRMPATVCGLALSTLVVDDGSGDRTAQVAREHGALVERLDRNRGGGAALRAGFDYAVSSGADIVVTMDADGQHLPEELETLVRPVADGRAALAIGSRILGHAEPNTFARELGISFFNRLISFLMRRRISDSSNGYRAFRTTILPTLDLRQQQFHTSEFLIESLARGVEVVEVPITVARRTHGTTKKPRTLRYGYGYARAIIGTWLRTLPLRVRPNPRSDHTPDVQGQPAPVRRDA